MFKGGHMQLEQQSQHHAIRSVTESNAARQFSLVMQTQTRIGIANQTLRCCKPLQRLTLGRGNRKNQFRPAEPLLTLIMAGA